MFVLAEGSNVASAGEKTVAAAAMMAMGLRLNILLEMKILTGLLRDYSKKCCRRYEQFKECRFLQMSKTGRKPKFAGKRVTDAVEKKEREKEKERERG